MAGDAQHAARMAARTRQLAEEKRQLEEAASSFHAKPLPPSTFGGPSFVPKPSDRPPLMPLENKLPGDARSKDRKAFDTAQKARVEAEAAQREALVAAREAEAEAEYEKLMETPVAEGGLRFVARPVPAQTFDGPDFVPEPSAAELTMPVTPLVLKRASARTSGMAGGAQRISAAN